MRRALALLLLLASGLVVWTAGSRLEGLDAGRGAAHHLLYLPNGKYLKLASLGNATLAADLIYIWSIQYYANFQIEDRYKYVDHVYSGIISELDPRYFDPYWLGALILSVETRDLDAAVALLDKGFANNPDKWIFPYLAGWEYAYAKRFDRAVEYFKKAAAVPSAPPDLVKMIAGMYQKEGNRRTALAEWVRIRQTTQDAGVRKVAENRIRALKTEIDTEELSAAIARFRAARGRTPGRLEELVEGGFIAALPESPDGAPYAYDRARGVVGSGEPRVIPR